MNAKRKASSTRDSERNSQDTQIECPICMNTTQTGHQYAFPCGHLICNTCNANMIHHRDNRCPSCRQPREGFTTETAAPPREQEDSLPMLVRLFRTNPAQEQDELIAMERRMSSGRRMSAGTIMFFTSEADPRVSLQAMMSVPRSNSGLMNVAHHLSRATDTMHILQRLLNPETQTWNEDAQPAPSPAAHSNEQRAPPAEGSLASLAAEAARRRMQGPAQRRTRQRRGSR